MKQLLCRQLQPRISPIGHFFSALNYEAPAHKVRLSPAHLTDPSYNKPELANVSSSVL
jgi:hypothetical protein